MTYELTEKDFYFPKPKPGGVINPNIYCNIVFTTPPARLAWPKLITPSLGLVKEGEDASKKKAKYEFQLLFDESKEYTQKFITELMPVVDRLLEYHNANADTQLAINNPLKKPKENALKKNPYYKGMRMITARNAERPHLLMNVKDPEDDTKMLKADPAFFESGMWVRAKVKLAIGPMGLSWTALLLQFLKDDGTRFKASFDVDDEDMYSLPSELEDCTLMSVDDAVDNL